MYTKFLKPALLLLAVIVFSAWLYYLGYNTATQELTLKFQTEQMKQVQTAKQKEAAATQKMQAALVQLEKEKENAKESTLALRSELNRLQQYATRNSRSKVAATTTSDGEATAKGWQLFGNCAKEYAELAEVADEQNADLHAWQAYGRTVIEME